MDLFAAAFPFIRAGRMTPPKPSSVVAGCEARLRVPAAAAGGAGVKGSFWQP